VHALSVPASLLRSPLLILLAATALASAFLGQASDAVIIGVILAASVGWVRRRVQGGERGSLVKIMRTTGPDRRLLGPQVPRSTLLGPGERCGEPVEG